LLEEILDMDIRFISSLTADDENALAAALLKAVSTHATHRDDRIGNVPADASALKRR